MNRLKVRLNYFTMDMGADTTTNHSSVFPKENLASVTDLQNQTEVHQVLTNNSLLTGVENGGGGFGPQNHVQNVANVLGICSVIKNLIVVFAVHFVKDKTSAYYSFIYSLAMSDIFAAIAFLVTQHWPFWTFSIISPDEQFFLAHAVGYLSRSLPWMFFTAYMLTLCCLSCSQFIAVCRPWQYTSVVSAKMVKISVALVWFIASLQIIIPLITMLVLNSYPDPKEAYNMMFRCSYVETHCWIAFYTLTIIVNFTLHLVTYLKLNSLKKKQSETNSRIDRMSMASKQEAFITITALLFTSAFCRVPFPIFGIVTLNIDVSSAGLHVAMWIDAITIFLLHANFLVDPIIIIVRTKDIKMVFVTFASVCLRRHRCCRRCWDGAPGNAGVDRDEEVEQESDRAAERQQMVTLNSTRLVEL